jgi:hypothetical protein
LVVQGGWEPAPRRCIIAAPHRIFFPSTGLGHFRRIDDVGDESASPPLASQLIRRKLSRPFKPAAPPHVLAEMPTFDSGDCRVGPLPDIASFCTPR